MSFILGNEDVLAAFSSASKTGHLSHSYIIEGAKGSGRLTLARAIAATLVCSKSAPCFSCNSCRKIMQGIHQDIQEIKCEEGSFSIKIETIRELIKEAYIKPAECDKKIFIIEDAQQMVPAAQNALLQIFEEPPANVMFFLLVTNRNLLLSTLKSRAVTLKTEKFSDEFIKQELTKRYPDALEAVGEAAILGDGALGKAISFMEDENSKRAVTIVKEYFSKLKTRGRYAELASVLSPAISDKNALFTVMSFFSVALRDIIVFSSGYREKAMFFSDSDLLTDLAKRLEKKKLFAAYETVCKILRDSSKINVTSALSSINMALADDFF